MAPSQDSTFIINDVVLDIPPSQIKIVKNNALRQFKTLRTKSSMKMRSGKASLAITMDVFFPDADSVNNKLRRLVAQFSLTPFCYVENQYLRDSVMGEDTSSDNMALALQNLTISTVPGQPGLIKGTFSFVWFNYKPYTKNFQFKDLPFINSPQREPGLAFQMFYLPELKRHSTVTFNDSTMKLSQFEFMLTANDEVIRDNNISLDINERSFDEFRGLLDEFIFNVNSIKENNSEQDESELQNFTLDSLSDITLRLGGGDPTVTNVGGVERALQESAIVASILSDAQIDTTNSLNEQKIKQLLQAQKRLVETAPQVFSNGDLWYEFPSALLDNSNTKSGPTPAKLYYRTRSIDFGREENGLIVEQMSMAHGNILTLLPMTGHQYPTAQYLGSSDKTFSLRVKAISDDAHRAWTTFMNVYNNNMQFGRLVPQMYTNIQVKNELFQFMNVTEILLEGCEEDTLPSMPGTYNLTMDFIERGIRPEATEKIRAIPTSFGETRRAVWDAIWRNIGVGDRGILIPVSKGARETAARDYLNRLISEFLTPTIQQMLGKFKRSGVATANLGTRFGAPQSRLTRDAIAAQGQSVKKKAFENIAALTALTDEEILGVEGLANVMWSWGAENPAESATVQLFGTNASSLYKSGVDGTRSYLRNKKENQINTGENRYKKIQAAMQGIEDYKAAIEQGGQSGSGANTIRVRDYQGNFVNISKVLQDAGLEEDFESQVIQAGEKDLFSGWREYRGRAWGLGDLAATIGDASVGDEQQDFIDDYLDDLRDELQSLEESLADGFQGNEFIDIFVGPGADSVFRTWPSKARDFADTVIYSSLIDLEMFAAAKQALNDMQTKSKGHVYNDIPMAEIEGVVRQALGGKYPEGEAFRLEPDFYFLNETADLNIGAFVEEQLIEQIKNYSEQYTQDVIANNKNWFQQTYLKEVGSSYAKMLTSSSEKQEVASKFNGQKNSPGMSQMKKAPSIAQSINNATASRGLDGKRNPVQGRLSINSVTGQVAPQPRHSLGNFLDSAGSVTRTPNTVIAQSAKELAASDQWIMPVEGSQFRFMSIPGKRNPTVGSKYHPGTDIAGSAPGEILGDPVYASAEGVIDHVFVDSGTGKGPGNGVRIKTERPTGTYYHSYFHFREVEPGLRKGQSVQKGQRIGSVGNTGASTGPHLHFEVRRDHRAGEIIWPFGTWVPAGFSSAQFTRDPSRPITQVPLISYEGSSIPITTVPGVAPSERGDTILQQSLKSMSKTWNNNAGYRMNRAYPGIYLSFIEEDTPGPLLVFDAFFNYQSVVSCDVVRDREVAADYCKMILTNVSGVLSNRQFEGTYEEGLAINNGKEARRRNNPVSKDDVKEVQIESLMLREGIKVEVRMGYSDNPNKLSTVIVGRIVGVQFDETSDIVQLEIQSLATELVQDIKGVDKAITETSFISDDANTGPLLENLMSSPECVSFGYWERGDRIGNTNRDILTRRWEWNPKPATDNIFAPDKAAMNAIDPGWFFDRIQYRMYQMTIWDVFKEMELRHPEYIGSPVPYEETNGSRKRMTMFFGLPDQLYFNRDPTITENRRAEEIKGTKEEIKNILIQAYKNGGRALEVARSLLETSSLAKSDRQELLNRLGNKQLPIRLRDREAGQTSADINILARIDEVVDAYIESELAKEAIESGSIQTFRKYHLLTSEMHIVSNSLRAKSSNTFNAVTVEYEDPDTIYVAGFTEEGEEGSSGLEIDDVETLTMKLDPAIPDEYVRENFVSFPNCLGEAMAKNYCVSLLQKGVWQTYSGELIILGNPDIKPYDICYIQDSYSDMSGPVQVRRVTHHFSHDTGYVTIITPDCVAYASEGAGLTQNQAMGLMAEVFFKKTAGLDLNIITPGRTPLDGAQTTPGLYQLAAAAGQLVNFFGGKRMLFRTQFDDPIHVVPLFKQGRPMVAGSGPSHLRRNFFATKGFGRELKEAMTGLMEGIDTFKIGWDKGLAQESRGRLFGENVVRRK